MIDLEAALTDLAEHLDHPARVDLVAAVQRELTAPARIDAGRTHRARRWLAVAAAVVLIVAATLAVSPARHAIADWLGIGAIDIRRSSQPLPTGVPASTVPGVPGTAVDHAATAELARARTAVAFTIVTPRSLSAGALLGVTVDARVPGGLVVLRYERFSLVEIASSSDTPVIAKVLEPQTRVDAVTVTDRPGLWISGAHRIAFLDRSGNLATDTVRRSGPVLVWGGPGVNYRIEGFTHLDGALRIATTVR